MSVRFVGPPAPALDAGSVHLWMASLSVSAAECGRLRLLLSDEERDRASRFVFERDRRWFTAARALLRSLLATYVDAPPDRLRFEYGKQGKPALHSGDGARVAFNLTHSGGLAAVAVTAGNAVGVDIEHMRPVDDLDSLARQCFAPGERARLAQLAATDRHEAFFNCWTRKEAYIKALGEGLSCPLETFEVTLTPGARARLQAIDGSTEAAARWWMHAFTPAPGFMGAVVVQGTGYRVQTGWIHTGATTADGAQPAFA